MSKVRNEIAILFKFIFPITCLCFGFITFYSIAKIEDIGIDTLYGYPFPYKCSGWHTSLSHQYFLKNLLIDFLFLFSIFYLVFKTLIFLFKIEPKIKPVFIKIFYTLFIIYHVLFFKLSEELCDVYYWKIDFKYEIKEKNVKFFFQNKDYEDEQKYYK